MRKAEKAGVLIDRCPSCSGIWLDAGELERLEADEPAMRSEIVQQARQELLEEAARLVSIYGVCPKCQAAKLTEVIKRGVKLDYCRSCKGMFFDDTELDRVMAGGEGGGFISGFIALFTVVRD